MNSSLWDKRIPTLLGLFLIVIGIGITTALVKSGAVVIGKASPSEKPTDIRITNISDTAFTVSYQTPESIPGIIAYGKTATLGLVAQDDRDQANGLPISHILHYITVENLEPQTRYSFTIESGKSVFGQEKEGNPPFVVTTQATPQAQGKGSTLVGQIVSADQTPLPETIVYLYTKGSTTLSALVNTDGTYALQLAILRTADGTLFQTVSSQTLLTMHATSPLGTSTVTLLPPPSGEVPTITLLQNYDFTLGTAPLAQNQEATASAENVFPQFQAQEVVGSEKKVQILSPQKDAPLTDDKPQFKGTALPQEDVHITIHSDTVVDTTITADKNGNWTFRPPQSLSPGIHTITIASRDPFGILKTITQSFTVFAAGNQVSQSATPSATIVPTATIAPTSIPTVAPIPTLGPSLTPSPTRAISLTPTLFPTAMIVSSTPFFIQPTVVPPGNNMVTTVGFGAFVMTAIGIALFLAAHLSSL